MDDLTLLFAYFEATLISAFDLQPAQVIVAKRSAREKQREGGLPAGINLQAIVNGTAGTSGVFVLSSPEGDQVDKAPTFRTMSRTYAINSDYCFRAMAAQTGSASGAAPAEMLEQPPVRIIRTSEIENLFITVAPSVPSMFDVRVKPGRSYDLPVDDKTIVVSSMAFLCTCQTPRPGK